MHLGGGETARIYVRSTETTAAVDRLRGLEIGTWWQDESRDASRYAYDVIMGRLRCRKVDRPEAILTTSPNGFDWIWELFVDDASSHRRLVHVTQRENRHLRAGYDEELRTAYDPQLARQELEAAFVAMGSGNVYPMFDRTVHLADLEYDPDLPIELSVDWNIDPVAWTLAQRPNRTEVQVIAEVFIRCGHAVGWMDSSRPSQPVPRAPDGRHVRKGLWHHDWDGAFGGSLRRTRTRLPSFERCRLT